MFLKLFLNSGLYLSDGCKSLLEELKKMKTPFSKDDLLVDFIDDNAKNYIFWHFENLESGIRKSKLANVSHMFSTVSKDDI